MDSGIFWVLVNLGEALYDSDKEPYEVRFKQGYEALSMLDELSTQKGINAWVTKHFPKDCRVKFKIANAVVLTKDTLEGKPTGAVVEHDTSSSGPLLQSIITRDSVGITNILGNNLKPSNLYQLVADNYNKLYGTDYKRVEFKPVVMTYSYCGSAVAKMLLGEKGFKCFEKVFKSLLPGSYAFRKACIKGWNSKKTWLTWSMPDNFQVEKPIITKEVELNPFTGEYKAKRYEVKFRLNDGSSHKTYTSCHIHDCIQSGEEGSLCLAPNLIHSLDAYVLRELNRRCLASQELLDRVELLTPYNRGVSPEIKDFIDRWEETNIVSIAVLDVLQEGHTYYAPKAYVEAVKTVVKKCTGIPFNVILDVHDAFLIHPNNVTMCKDMFNEILVELYDSEIMAYWNKTQGLNVPIGERSDSIREYIRNSVYALN